jgi:hypothetical protein
MRYVKADDFAFDKDDNKYYLAWHDCMGHGFYYRKRSGDFNGEWCFSSLDWNSYEVPLEELSILMPPTPPHEEES